jgi:hypothetical protein
MKPKSNVTEFRPRGGYVGKDLDVKQFNLIKPLVARIRFALYGKLPPAAFIKPAE